MSAKTTKVQWSMDADGNARQSCRAISNEGSVKMVAIIDGSVQDSSYGIRGCDNLLLLLFKTKNLLSFNIVSHSVAKI